MINAFDDYVRSTWDTAAAAEEGAFLAARKRALVDARQGGQIRSGERWINEAKLFAEHTEYAVRACFVGFVALAASVDQVQRAELWHAVKRGLSPRVRQYLDSWGRALERQAENEGCGSNSLKLALSQTLGQRISNLLKLIDDLVRQQVSADIIKAMGSPPSAARPIHVAGDYYERVEQMRGTNNLIGSNSTVTGVTQVGANNQVKASVPVGERSTKTDWGNRALVVGAIVAAIITGVATLLSTEHGRQLLRLSTKPHSAKSAPGSAQSPTGRASE